MSLLLPWLFLGLLTLILAVDVGVLSLTRGRMQLATEAAAIAAALALVDDRSLIDAADLRESLAREARSEAVRYALANRVAGRFEADPDRPGSSPVDVDFLDDPETQGHPERRLGPDLVRVCGFRTRSRTEGVLLLLSQFCGIDPIDLVVRSSARVERRIVGFRPLAGRPIPLVPIGLLSDPTGTDPRSWESQVSARPHDNYAFDPSTRGFVADHGDGLPEVALTLGTTAVPLNFTEPGDLAEQVEWGLTARDLATRGGQFVLAEPGCSFDAIPPSGRLSTGNRLGAALDAVRAAGLPRVWPLFRAARKPGGSIEVTGFVAGRVVRLERGSAARLWIQPAALATSTALAGADVGPVTRLDGEPVPKNPYIAKVRLIE